MAMLSVISHHITVGFCLAVVFKPVTKILLHHWKHDNHLMLSSHDLIDIGAGSVFMKLNVM
jgi:hypothetical protein